MTWKLPKALSPDTFDCSSPSVAAAGSQVLATYWATESNSLVLGLKLYLRRPPDKGATWQPAKIIAVGQILL